MWMSAQTLQEKGVPMIKMNMMEPAHTNRTAPMLRE
jgi:hypothetical protein